MERNTLQQHVSSFDLEPNPFEQSFASTKKDSNANNNTNNSSTNNNNTTNSNDNNTSAQTNNSNSTNIGSGSATTSVVATHGKTTLSQHHQPIQPLLGLVNNNNVQPLPVTAGGGLGQSGLPQKSPLRYHHAPGLAQSATSGPHHVHLQQPKLSMIQSPPLLTPGGSHRLPSMLLSPQILQAHNAHPEAMAQGQLGTAGVAAGTSAVTGGTLHSHQMPALSPLIPGAPSNGQASPGFLMGLAKTGLTPNESNIRTGLTPGILNPSQPGSLPLPTSGQFTPGLSSMLSGIPLGGGTRTPSGAIGSHPHSLSTVLEVPSSDVSSLPGGVVSTGPARTTNISLEIPPEKVKNPGTKDLKRSSSSVDDVLDSEGSGSSVKTNTSSAGTTGTSATVTNNNKSLKGSGGKSGQGPSNFAVPSATSSEGVAAEGTSSSPVPGNAKKKFKKSQSAPIDNEDEDERERKRKEFLERNRLAASKFRKRKKEYIKKIETDLQFYETEYSDLSMFVDRLVGFIPSSKGTEQGSEISLLRLLKQALIRQELGKALSITNQIEQLMLSTKYVQRNGRNPRLDEEQLHDEPPVTAQLQPHAIRHLNPPPLHQHLQHQHQHLHEHQHQHQHHHQHHQHQPVHQHHSIRHNVSRNNQLHSGSAAMTLTGAQPYKSGTPNNAQYAPIHKNSGM